MNRIYKVIWSKTKNCYVVASELAKRCTKSASSKKLLTTVVSLAVLVGISGSAFAQDPVYYDDDYAEQITLEGPIGVGTKITNVANGLISQASMDAVNGSQLYGIQQSVNTMNGTISNLSSSIAVAQTDISGIKTNYVTLNSTVNTLKTQVETGFNVTINGAKVKTVNPDSNMINFSAGNNVSIVNDNGTIKISATGGDGTVGAYYMENGRNTTVATRYDEGNNTIYSVAVNDFGTVASDSEGLVTGKTMHTELRPTADGSYITSANTTAQNLTALDTAVGGAVNSLAVSGQTLTYTKGDGSTGTITLPAGGEGGTTYTAGNGIEISSENAISAKAGTNVTVDANGISVTGAGTVASDDTRLVTGKTVYDEVRPTQDGTYVVTANTTGANLLALDSQVKTNSDAITQINTDLGGKANTSLDNITDDGKTVIQNATNVVSGDDIIDVTSTTADGVKTYTVKANISANGEIAEGNTGLVSGGTVYDALHTQANATADALDGKANIALDNINDDGKSVVRTLAQEAVKVVDGTNTTVTEGTDGNAKTYAVAVNVNGQIAENNEGLVTGGDIFDYVQDAVSDLDTFAKKDASNVSSDADKWGTALGIGAVAENDGKLVTGGTVYSALKDATDTISTALDSKANIALDNISDDGKTVVRTLAQEAVKVINGTNTTVTEGTDGNAKTYAVSVSANGQVAEGNTGIVTGGDVYDYVQGITGGAVAPSDLAAYAKKDASNVTDPDAWGTAIATGAVADGDVKAVSGDTIYDALQTAKSNLQTQITNYATLINTQLNNKANIAMDNINDDGKTVIRGLAQEAVTVTGGDNITVAESTDGNAKVYTVSADITGTVTSGDTGLVSGGQVYDAIQGITPTTYTAGEGIAINADNIISVVKDGVVADGDTGIVTGGTVYDAINGTIGDATQTALDGKANIAMDNINNAGKAAIRGLAQKAVKVVPGQHTSTVISADGTYLTYAVDVDDSGLVAEGNANLLMGGVVFSEVRPDADGTYIARNNTTGANLTALDAQVKANADAIEVLQQSGGGGVPANMVAYDDNTKASVTLAGQDGTTIKNVKAGTDTTDAVNLGQLNSVKDELGGRITATENLLAGDWKGKTVKEMIDEKVDTSTFTQYKESTATTLSNMNDAIQNKANKDLDNISDAGKSVVRGLAQEAIDVKGEGAITVTSSVENDVKTYTVTVATDGVVEAGNTGIVTGDTVYNAIQDANTATQTALDGKANASLDNITDDAKDVIRDAVKDDLDAKADKDSVYTKDETDTKLSEKADLSYVDNELDKKADKTELDKKADKSYVDEGLDKKADKSELKKKANTDASNIDTDKWAEKLGTGAVEEGNTGLVNGGVVYEALQDVTGNDIIKADADAGAIRIGNKAKYDDMDSVDISKSDGSTRVLKGIKTDANDPTSAANVAYVDGMAQGVLDNMKSGFERLDDRISETGAKAAALAGLHPFEIDGDQKWNIAAGVGTYDGKTSGAFGVFYRPTDRVMYNLASTVGDGKAMVSGGVSIALDKGITGMSKRQMAEEIRQIKAENAQLKEAIAYLMQKVEQGAVQNTVQK